MPQNNDLLSVELNKWTKNMLVDYIVTQSLPVGVKFSEDLSLFLKNSSSNPLTISPENPINVASILQSVVVELKSVALSNSKLHDKLNRLNMSTSGTFASKSNTEPKNLPIITVHPKLDADSRPRQPGMQLTNNQPSSSKPRFIVGSHKNSSSKLSSVPVQKHADIFVSRLDPCVTSTMLESELFNSYTEVTINKIVTRHPSYSSFHVRLPADKLDEVLEPVFWSDGVMVKRFWGRLTPEMILNSTPKN
ncbi:Uncharacterized protein FWK35_00027076 [Aphis craccivora]|uniref:Uncharacterized protein n=1 Tax=Aphis craccivora TaxID=307492 RepID=A0A6G0VQX9_APHCR|nr:Uncharacterized protein FWK35_00027076 [Aphis craccivora]